MQAEREQRLFRLAAPTNDISAGIVHDLRNMLAVANSGAALLRAPLDPPSRDGIVAAIQQALLSAERLASSFAAPAISRAPRRCWIDIAALLAEQSTLYAGSLPDNILLRVDSHMALPPVWLDRARLEAALLNLVLNARDAMPVGGVLTIRVKPLPRRIRLIVADTGTGMDAETLRRVGTPFFSLKGRKGTGLGLAQIRRFADEIEGRISLRSREGQGTVVLLDLPY